jgi:hypothetical protein
MNSLLRNIFRERDIPSVAPPADGSDGDSLATLAWDLKSDGDTVIAGQERTVKASLLALRAPFFVLQPNVDPPRMASTDVRKPKLDFPGIGACTDFTRIHGDTRLPLVAELEPTDASLPG